MNATDQPTVLIGGKGNDIYMVLHEDDQVIELAGEGVDEVRTVVSYTLPPHVENMSVYGPGSGTLVLTGNALNNHIVGAPFSYETIYGLDGDDTLDGGGRHGGLLDGGNGNDRLIVSFGELRGGPGADTFVAGGRGAMTAPDAAITVLDFNANEGDRIEIKWPENLDAAALFASGQLIFQPETQRLIFTMDPVAFQTNPYAVEQIFLLPGVVTFDPSHVRVLPGP
ncbi:MAG TPA: hypothetical protein VLJ86_17060 [Ramlibacter sp.]|nr:hypothetical protein [Ramlibacter sp.]